MYLEEELVVFNWWQVLWKASYDGTLSCDTTCVLVLTSSTACAMG